MITKSVDNITFIEWPTSKVLAFTTNRLSATKSPLPTSAKNTILADNIQTSIGPSLSMFDAFNLGDHVDDCPNTVTQNRKSLLAYLPVATKIQWVTQVHGNNVVVVEQHHDKPLVADAAITRNKKIALAIMTADCLPILVSNSDGSEIAAIHAGWRPLAANIIERTLKLMHSPVNELYVWLGPCIGEHVFEVGEEVKHAFCQNSIKYKQAFKPVSSEKGDKKKYLANLHMMAQLQLLDLGVKNISALDECTFSLNQKYYSYRRDGLTGRMASIISSNS